MLSDVQEGGYKAMADSMIGEMQVKMSLPLTWGKVYMHVGVEIAIYR